MPIITISKGTYSRGNEVAEKVAQKLGYECIAQEVLAAASKDFDISEVELLHAIHDAPSLLSRLVYGKEKYVAYVQKVLLHHLQKDNVVYHGLAGHFFVRDVSHVLKVRIITAMEDRVRLIRERDGVSRKEALRFIGKLDEQRKKWSRQMYGSYSGDPKLYDLVINVNKDTIDDAVDLICHVAGMKEFQTTLKSQKAMDDLVLTAEIKAALIDLKPDIEVSGLNGIIHVNTTVPESQEEELVHKINEIAINIQGVKEIKVHTFPSVPYGD